MGTAGLASPPAAFSLAIWALPGNMLSLFLPVTPITHTAQAARKQVFKNLSIGPWNWPTFLVHFKMHTPFSPRASCILVSLLNIPDPKQIFWESEQKSPLSHSSLEPLSIVNKLSVLIEAMARESGHGLRQGAEEA